MFMKTREQLERAPQSPDSHCYTTIFAAAVLGLLFAVVADASGETDQQIESSAKKSFVFRTYLAADSVTAHSTNGAVTLTGVVKDGSHKALAHNTVLALSGVKSVDNQIEVRGAPSERSDAWLLMKVKDALALHHSISSLGIQIVCKGGAVTLSAAASTLSQKELATEYASAVDGVRSVKNDMTVPDTQSKPGKEAAKIPSPKPVAIIDDASISAQVKMALAADQSTSLIRTSVTTQDGVVTLGGNAGNKAEQEEVTKLATDINGVVSVINNMTLAAPVAAK